MNERKPEIIVFAGPNGSGKSTFTVLLKPSYDYINADEIKAIIKCSDIEAAETAEKLRLGHLAQRTDFSFETVLSTPRNLDLLKKAKEAGYFIKCFYVLTADSQINLARVKFRVLSGGHDVPEDKILTRYNRALDLLPGVLEVCDIFHLYDNSKTPYRIFKKRKNEFYYDPCPELWSSEEIKNLTKKFEAVYKNLNEK